MKTCKFKSISIHCAYKVLLKLCNFTVVIKSTHQMWSATAQTISLEARWLSVGWFKEEKEKKKGQAQLRRASAFACFTDSLVWNPSIAVCCEVRVPDAEGGSGTPPQVLPPTPERLSILPNPAWRGHACHWAGPLQHPSRTHLFTHGAFYWKRFDFREKVEKPGTTMNGTMKEFSFPVSEIDA